MATRKQLAALAKARRVRRMKASHRRMRAAGYHIGRAMILARPSVGMGRRRRYRRRRIGGFAPQVLLGVHQALKQYRPVSAIENVLDKVGLKSKLDSRFGNSKVYQGLKKVGNFLTGTLGYGRRRRYRRRRHLRR